MKGSASSKKNVGKHYKVFCVNMNGSGLQTIKSIFEEQCIRGLRSTLFTIDLEKEILNHYPNSERSSSDNTAARVAEKCIQKCLQQFDILTASLEYTKNFNINDYWLKERTSISKKNGEKSKQAPSHCKETIVRSHNRIGSAKILEKDLIRDSPWDPNIFIIILFPITNKFITDLINLKEPLRAIIDLSPDLGVSEEAPPLTACKMLEYRENVLMKTVGIFQETLPIISLCIAKNNAEKIFNDLTYLFYDKELQYEFYLKYYFQPFIITNVSLDESIDLVKTCSILKSEDSNGHFHNKFQLGAAPDLATIAFFLGNLISMATNRLSMPSSFHRILLTTAISKNVLLNHLESLSELTEIYSHAFSSITKVKKFERIVIENANTLLKQLIQYCDQRYHKNIYATCLEYSVLRDYVLQNNDCPQQSARHVRPLPQYFRYLGTADSTIQKINEYIERSDNYNISEIYPGELLYTFERCFDTIIESSVNRFIPSRLCYRDFTIFQLNEFKRDFIAPPLDKFFPDYTPKTADSHQETKGSSIEDSLFIRLNSLKARQPLIFEKRYSSINTFSRNKTLSLVEPIQNYGLPSNHTLLRGYNFEDSRQEVCLSTARYNFEEGFLELYSENWGFTLMNKLLRFNVNNNLLTMYAEQLSSIGIQKKFCFVSKNDIHIALMPLNSNHKIVVINYPNGLEIYKHRTSVEQRCKKKGYLGEEKKRIHTSTGAIIVLYGNYSIIMRPNGEIYELFNFDPNIIGEEIPSSLEEEYDKIETNISSKMTKDELEKSVKFELEFLMKISLEFNLKFIHLTITTSSGRVVHKNTSGDMYETRSKVWQEWHDYQTDEYFVERDDNTKFIWTSECSKCFFSDGSMITTYVTEDFIADNDAEEFELDCFESWGNSWGMHRERDKGYITYEYFTFLHHHDKLCDVAIKKYSTSTAMDIFGADNMHIIEENEHEFGDEYIIDFKNPLNSKSFSKSKFWQAGIRISLDESIFLSVTEDLLELELFLSHITSSGTVKEPVNFSCNMTRALNMLFKDLAQKISEFKINNPKIQENYIIKNNDENGGTQGLEFLNFTPKVGKNCHKQSNTIIEFVDLKSVDDKVTNVNEQMILDLVKFPRFPSKKRYTVTEELPMTVGVNLYVKIPCSMKSLESLHTFLESLFGFNYKKTRPMIKEALVNLLSPWIYQDEQKVYSKKSWQLRKDFESERGVRERQRLGFYIAMMKYKKYPKYRQFHNNKFMGRIQNFDIIDFISEQCVMNYPVSQEDL